MPLNAKAFDILAQLANADPDFTLFGLAINPKTGEMGTFCSHPFEPGQILGFLAEGVKAMVDAAKHGELEGVDEHGEYHTCGTGTSSGGGKLELVH